MRFVAVDCMNMDVESAEAKRINDEYTRWKKLSPFLYDWILTHAMEWPSLTCQWLPTVGVGTRTQQLLLGTQTTGQDQNYLMVAQTHLPQLQCEKEEQDKDPSISLSVSMQQKICHDGEVNRARYMPQNPKVVATKTVSAAVFIFDLDKHPALPERDECIPDLKLKGHRKEGYGLDFNPKKEGILASGSDDSLVCVWDIGGCLERGAREMQATSVFRGHTKGVEDVCWHPQHENILASVADDKILKTWDTRQRDEAQETVEAHSREANAVSFNPFSQFVLATGSSDKTIALWDMRNLKRKLHSFEFHDEEVFNIQWAPFKETILASSSADRRICFWDISKITAPQTPQDEEDGPPELLFMHAGHTARISDLSWNPVHGEDWVIASVAEDNVLQLWRVAEPVYRDDASMDDDTQA